MPLQPETSTWRHGEPPFPSAGRAWYMVAILMVALVFSFVDRIVISLLVDPIRTSLNISDTQLSLLHGLSFAIFYTVMGIPIAKLADTGNRRVIIAVGVACWSLATAACGLARSFLQLAVFRVGVGAGEAALSPAAYSLIADSFPRERLGRATSVFSLGGFVGAGAAFLAGGAAIDYLAQFAKRDLPIIGSHQGWQLAFFAIGAPGLIVAALMFTFREPFRRGKAPVNVPAPQGLLAHLRERRAMYACHFFGFALLVMFNQSMYAWSPSFFIRSFSYTPGQIGLWLGAITAVFGSAGIMTGGYVADRIDKSGRADAVMITGLIAALGLLPFAVFAPLMPNAQLALLLYIPLTFFVSFPFGAAPAALQIIAPCELRAQVSAIYLFTVNIIGLGFGPTLTAIISDYAFADSAAIRFGIAIMGGFCCLGSILLFTIGRRHFSSADARI